MGLFSVFKKSLQKTSVGIEDALRGVVGLAHGRVPEEVLEELEEALILADVGLDIATEAIDALRLKRFKDDDTVETVKLWLADFLAQKFKPVAEKKYEYTPTVILMLGVNGAGKTTTLGKLAHRLRGQGRDVLVAAGDTYRAGAAGQLEVWAQRADVDFVAPNLAQQDVASFLFGAYEKAVDEGYDTLMCDTAGRLQNRMDLMDELKKIIRVLKKQDAHLPHESLLVLDATVGQNALQQVKAFADIAPVTGLVVNKLDGSAKAGVLVALAGAYDMPILWVGTGESIEDIEPFDARAFCQALVGVEA